MYSNRKLIWKTHLEIIDFHNKFADKQLLLCDYNKKLRICNKIVGYGCTICVLSCIIYPIFVSIFLSKKKVLGFGFLLPFTDPEELFGYFLNYVFQNVEFIICGFGFIAFLRLYLLLFTQTCLRLDILKNTVDGLTDLVLNNEDSKQDKKISSRINEIVQLHMEYLRLIYGF